VVVGEFLKGLNLVTGLIVAILGVEKTSGDFEAMDICYPGAAPQVETDDTEGKPMEVDTADEWIALVSGLNIGPPSAPSDLRINLLVEYLLGENGDAADQRCASRVARLIIAGDSFAPINYDDPDAETDAKVTVPGEIAPLTAKKATKKYGYEAGSFSAHPTQSLSGHLTELSKSMVVHLIPGASDPSGITLPQQPLPRAMFGDAKNYESFHVETNPCWIGAGACQ
jgi:DNA polymerase delta subunit 2